MSSLKESILNIFCMTVGEIMDSIILDLDSAASTPLYVQLYEYIKNEILCGHMSAFEKLPSIRNLSSILNISKSTIEAAYDQLLVEGYIFSKPQSGYYVHDISIKQSPSYPQAVNNNPSDSELISLMSKNRFTDPVSFDFVKWKKCLNHVLTDYGDLLLIEADPQGERNLRNEISKYVYQSRGVQCHSEQIVIGAGTQHIMHLLSIILEKMDINHLAFEDPGFYPARKVFMDRGFDISPVPIGKDGIQVPELKKTRCRVAYVSPSHQFPLGSVMPIAKRHELLEWAYETNSFIIEDDYDSELRYFSRPVPALQGLDKQEKVIYLGSFSTTLLPSTKISYIVLPGTLLKYYQEVKDNYSQTCSKIEQLTLALYMKDGLYLKHIKRLRNLYSNKVQILLNCLENEMEEYAKVLSHDSGIHVLLEIHSLKSSEKLCQEASEAGIEAVPLDKFRIRQTENKYPVILLYYTQIPISDIPNAIRNLKKVWNK